MDYSNFDNQSLKFYQLQIANLCMYLELLIRRGEATPEIAAIYDRSKAEIQKIEKAFFEANPELELQSKQELLNQGLIIFNRYIASVYDPDGDTGNKYTCDYNHPVKGKKTLTFITPTNPTPEEMILDMNDIDTLYADFDIAMDDLAKDLPNAE